MDPTHPDENLELIRRILGMNLMCEDEPMTPLHLAAGQGRTHLCSSLIATLKMDINSKTDKGYTPLHLALGGKHFLTAEYLINCGANVNASDYQGSTALHCAATRGYKEFIKLLISKGADIEADSDVGSPLQSASINGQRDSIEILLEHKADANLALGFNHTPVVLSMKATSPECLDLLIKGGADPNLISFGKPPLAYAAEIHDTRYIESLLRAGANPNKTCSVSSFIFNVLFFCRETIGCFYELQAGMTPIEHAALARNNDGVLILFRVTTPLPSIPDWSFKGIMSYVHSEQIRQQINETFLLAKEMGATAFHVKDYKNAILCYTEAMQHNLKDATVWSNRSLCFARLEKEEFALKDAQACVQLKPDWGKAHYREGAAWMLIKNYVMASEAFSKALKLDPNSKEIREALRNAMELVP